MQRQRLFLLMTIGCIYSLALIGLYPTRAAPPKQGGAVSGSFGDPGDMYLEFTISGADFEETRAQFYQAIYEGGEINLSGKAIVTRSSFTGSYVSVYARVGDQIAQFPAEGGYGWIENQVLEFPFDLSFTVPPDYPTEWFNGRVSLDVCADSCGTYTINFHLDIPEAAPTEAGAFPLPGSEPEPGSEPDPGYDPDPWDDPIVSESTESKLGAVIGGVIAVGAAATATLVLGVLAVGVAINRSKSKRAAKSPPGGENPPGIYGTGTKADPFRDKAALKLNPDGSFSHYPENAQVPVRIEGKGTRDDPYRNAAPGQPAAPVSAPVASAPQAGKQPAKKEPPEKKKQPDRVIDYQIDCQPGQTSVESGKPSAVQAQVWAVYQSGLRQPAPQVMMQAICDEPALAAQPAAGAGSLFVNLSLNGKPASQSANLTFYAYPPGMAPISTTIPVQIKARQDTPILQVQLDPNRRTVYPDGQDMLALWARVIYQDPQAAPDADLQAANDSLEFIREGEAENWLYDNEPQKSGDWTAFWIKPIDLLEYNRQFGPTHPPTDGVTVIVQARYQDQTLSERLVFKIQDAPVLKTDRNRIEFCAGKTMDANLIVWLEGDWPGVWRFIPEFEGEELADVQEPSPGESPVRLRLSGPKVEPERGLRLNDSYIRSRLVIRAQQQANQQVEIEASVEVLVFQEGLYVVNGLDQQGYCVLRGDLETDQPERRTNMRFKALAWDEHSRQMIEDPQAVLNLQFSSHPSNSNQLENTLAAARLKSEHLSLAGAPPGTWALEFGLTIPSKNTSELRGALTVRSEEKPEYEAELPIKVRLLLLRDTDDWQRAYDNLIHIIKNYLPEKDKREALEFVDTHKNFWGLAELNEQRHKIWERAEMLITQEGVDYRAAAERWDWALWGAEGVKYVNDIFFDLTATGILLNPVAVLAAKEIKDAVEVIIQSYIKNPNMDWNDWFQAYAWGKFRGSVKNVGNFSVKELGKYMKLSDPTSLAVLGVWRFINHYFWVPDGVGRPKGFLVAVTDTFKDLYAEVVKMTLKGAFQQWGVTDGWIDPSEL